MNRTLKALSALLGYPSAELQAATGEIGEALRDEAALPAASLRALEPLLARLATADLMELQADYTGLFDGSRALSLHLFEHVHGESRDRGQAMIDLGRQYLDRGFMIATSELADYLPLFLEFLAFLPPREADEWLGQPAHVLAALGERLGQRGSPYAAVFEALLTLPRARPDAEALAALRARMQAADAEPQDERWAEEPVSFSAPVEPNAARPTGIAVRIRAALGKKQSTGQSARNEEQAP